MHALRGLGTLAVAACQAVDALPAAGQGAAERRQQVGPARAITRTLAALGLERGEHFQVRIAREPLPYGRRRRRTDPPGAIVGLRIDVIEDQVVERLVAANAGFIERETAQAGFPCQVRVVGAGGRYVVPAVTWLVGRPQQPHTAF
jgi:hypothetical protein